MKAEMLKHKPIARHIDDRRRLVVPEGIPPGSAVIIQPIGDDAWILRVQHPKDVVKLVAIPVIENFPDDPEWEKKEKLIAGAAIKGMPEPNF